MCVCNVYTDITNRRCIVAVLLSFGRFCFKTTESQTLVSDQRSPA